MLAVAILAAGKGTRMKSTLPKVLQLLAGKTLIERVLSSCKDLEINRKFIIIGHQADKIRNTLEKDSEIEFVIQKNQLGTGHAVQQLLPLLKDFSGELVILNGDVPLIKQKTIKELIRRHRSLNAGVTFLSTKPTNPSGYGRVFANNNGKVKEIIEDKDCDQEQKKNILVNSGIYCFHWPSLKSAITKVNSNNKQGEIYLTDTIKEIEEAYHLEVEDSFELDGINDRIQLAKCEQTIQTKLRRKWMESGVNFIDPNSCTLSEESIFGKDVIIQPQTHFQGECLIGDHCNIGPGCLIKNSRIGGNTSIIYSVLENATIKDNVQIGPFANIRPQSIISENCKIGNFVEIKKSLIKDKTKISHLSYIGDSTIGKNVNIGAGTITANYDGLQKHKTIIGDNSKTGANSVLIAPIVLGEKTTIGAGSTITKNVPNEALAIARAKQKIKVNWFKRIQENTSSTP